MNDVGQRRHDEHCKGVCVERRGKTEVLHAHRETTTFRNTNDDRVNAGLKGRRVQSRSHACRRCLLNSGTVDRLTVRRTSVQRCSATTTLKPIKICCQRLEARFSSVEVFEECSGGNSRPLRPSGVGGGHFLIKNQHLRYRAALRDRTNSAALLSLTLSLAVTLVNALLLVTLAIDIPAGRDSTALGVFFRFQITDFDCRFGFFSLCHFYFS